MQKFKSVEQIINQLKPEKPIYCIRKNSIRSAVKYFNKNFPGKILICSKDKSTSYCNSNNYR
jgi:ornithine decarboxylase